MSIRSGLTGLTGLALLAGLGVTAPASIADLVYGLRDSLLNYLTIPLGSVPFWEP